MNSFSKGAVFCAVSMLAVLGSASAERFDGVNRVEISDFTGRITVKVEGAAVDATLIDGDKPFAVDISRENGVLVIDGPDRPRSYKIHHEINWRRHEEKAFEIFLEDYPLLNLSVPAGTHLEFDDAITIATVGDLDGDIAIEGGYVEAIIGDVTNADIGVKGPGDIKVGVVANELRAGVGGSGDFEAVSAGVAKLSVGGSGDLKIGAIAGDASISVGGSGDVETGDIGGAVSMSVAGSGNVTAGKIGAGADLSVAGSGDITAGSVNGHTKARISGSGDIEIADGRAEDLEVSINGSGDFIFDGVSTNLRASVNGSGLVSVAANEGSLHTTGRGEFRVGGKRLKRDRD